MCGISGIITKADGAVPRERIEKINNLIEHRGPDGEGYFHGRNFAFGHRRLAILDPSDRGHQPMCYQERFWITYNGEIYNYLEVRSRLEAKGHSFVTGTDTEVILAAYAEWGYECLQRFNGMWAFAIYDAIEETIFLARDRFGIKPLYYLDTGNEYVFGSELRQLIALQPVVTANRTVVIESLLTYVEGHTADTYFSGVKSVPQSHYAVYDLRRHTTEFVRYYDLNTTPDVWEMAPDDAIDRFRELFDDSVRLRLRSDVRVGSCLSGGLDSSAVSGVASRHYRTQSADKFIGIHAKALDAEVDESAHARLVARHFDLELRVVEPSVEDFVHTLDDVVMTQEEPFGSPSMFMGWHVFREAATVGCKVMLNGQGGDEVLLGYERYFAAYLHAVSMSRFAHEMLAQSRNSRLRLRDVAMYYVYFTNAAFRIRRLKRRSMLRRAVKNDHDFETIRRSARSFRNLSDMQIDEITGIQLPHLLRYEDRNSMRHSIETRLPFLDYRLVELCVSLHPDSKIRDGWTKYALRKAFADTLPKSITWRRDKLGFQAPERTWLAAHADRMLEEVAASKILAEVCDRNRLLSSFATLSLKEKWSYFCLAAWERVFGVSW
jgi:asparagine synthase (glutamine-hydrolysing)